LSAPLASPVQYQLLGHPAATCAFPLVGTATVIRQVRHAPVLLRLPTLRPWPLCTAPPVAGLPVG
jgi:hypothetical protein